MALEALFPEGKIVRTTPGGPDALEKLLANLERYKFTGYVRLLARKSEGTESGFIVVRRGEREMAAFAAGDHESHGRAALRRVVQESYSPEALLEVHAGVDVEDLIRANPEMSLVISVGKPVPADADIVRARAREWRDKGFDVTPLDAALREGPAKVREVFLRYQEDVKRAEILLEVLDGMTVPGIEKDVTAIRERLRNPANSLAMEAEVEVLRERMEKAPGATPEATAAAAHASRVLQSMLLPPKVRETEEARDERTNLIKRFTFDSFVVGPSNRFAQAACLAVARNPHTAYNPLFITSGPGLGKTHLLNAIGNGVQKDNAEATMMFTDAERFASELKEARSAGTLADFQAKYRGVDLLLFDDVHFLAGKVEAQEELFHTFNALHNAGKRIALTSDRPAKEIPMLEERLISRFESGLVADIVPPEFETRMAILRRKARDAGADLDDELLAFIANLVQANVRELGGALNRVLAYSQLMNKPITLDMAREVLKDLVTREEAITKRRVDQVPIKASRSYLIEEEKANNAFQLVTRVLADGGQGLVVSRSNPRRLKERYNLGGARILWLTDKESAAADIVPPRTELIRDVIEKFMGEAARGIILLDGVEYLLSDHSFEAVHRFLCSVRDHVAESQHTFLVAISPYTVGEKELKNFEREMEVVNFLEA